LGNVYEEHAFDTAYREFIQTLTYYLDIAIPLRKMNMIEQIKKTPGISKSSEKLKFLIGYIKESNVSTELINYCNKCKIIYHKVIRPDRRMYYEKQISESVSKSKTCGIWSKINQASWKGDMNLSL